MSRGALRTVFAAAPTLASDTVPSRTGATAPGAGIFPRTMGTVVARDARAANVPTNASRGFAQPSPQPSFLPFPTHPRRSGLLLFSRLPEPARRGLCAQRRALPDPVSDFPEPRISQPRVHVAVSPFFPCQCASAPGRRRVRRRRELSPQRRPRRRIATGAPVIAGPKTTRKKRRPVPRPISTSAPRKVRGDQSVGDGDAHEALRAVAVSPARAMARS